MNANRMKKIGKYDIPANVYSENDKEGIPPEVVNDMITSVINKEPFIASTIKDYFNIIGFMFPEEQPQIDNILLLLRTIECDVCETKETYTNPKKKEL